LPQPFLGTCVRRPADASVAKLDAALVPVAEDCGVLPTAMHLLRAT